MNKFTLVSRAKLKKKLQAEREAKKRKRPKQLPWKKSRDGASQVLNDRVTEKVTFKEYLIKEAKYHNFLPNDLWHVYLQNEHQARHTEMYLVKTNTKEEAVELALKTTDDWKYHEPDADNAAYSVAEHYQEILQDDPNYAEEWLEDEQERITNIKPGQVIHMDTFS